jgi:hypothetical protein
MGFGGMVAGLTLISIKIFIGVLIMSIRHCGEGGVSDNRNFRQLAMGLQAANNFAGPCLRGSVYGQAPKPDKCVNIKIDGFHGHIRVSVPCTDKHTLENEGGRKLPATPLQQIWVIRNAWYLNW